VCGVGEGGGKLAECFLRTEGWLIKHLSKDIVGYLFVNTDEKDFETLSVSQSKGKLFAIGEAYTRGTGTGRRWKIGEMSAISDSGNVLEAAEDSGRKNDLLKSNMLFFTFSLGGGTGAGATPILLEAFRKRFLKAIPEKESVDPRLPEEYHVPSLAMSIFPEPNPLYYFNAACALARLMDNVDGVILCDNESIMKGKRLFAELPEVNQEIASKLEVLFYPGRTDIASHLVVDAADIQSYTRVLDKAGFCVPCYAQSEATSCNVRKLTEEAVKNGPMVECDYKTATKAILVVSGNPSYVNLDDVEAARRWLSNEIVGSDVKAGVAAVSKPVVEVLAILNSPQMRKLERIIRVGAAYARTHRVDLSSKSWLRLDKDEVDKYFAQLQSYLKEIENHRVELRQTKKDFDS